MANYQHGYCYGILDENGQFVYVGSSLSLSPEKRFARHHTHANISLDSPLHRMMAGALHRMRWQLIVLEAMEPGPAGSNCETESRYTSRSCAPLGTPSVIETMQFVNPSARASGNRRGERRTQDTWRRQGDGIVHGRKRCVPRRERSRTLQWKQSRLQTKRYQPPRHERACARAHVNGCQCT